MILAAGALVLSLSALGLVASPTIVCSLADPAINESSGLATSSYDANNLLTHNDSGGRAAYYVIDRRTGATLGSVTVEGATNVDWEDIAVSGHTVYLADIGDNRASRRSVTIYAAPERRVDSFGRDPHATATKLTYDDGPRDAEALLVPPGGKPRFIVSKQLFGARVYAIEGTHLRRVADLDAGLITGASWSPDGSRIALVSYTGIHVYDAAAFPKGQAQTLALPPLRQAESITWSGNGAVLVGSEGVHSPIYRVAVPRVSAETSTPTPAASRPSSAASSSATSSSPGGASASVTALKTPSTTPSGAATTDGSAPPAAPAAARKASPATPIAAVVLVLALVAVAATRVRRRARGGLG